MLDPHRLDCQSFHVGHHVHWIQALRGAHDRENLPTPARVLAVNDDGTITVVTDAHETVWLWTHDPERLRELLGDNPSTRWHERWSLLRVADRDSDDTFLVSVCRSLENRTRCVPIRVSATPAMTGWLNIRS